MMREILLICCQNQLLYRYVLADSWFCSTENMMFIRHACNKHFLMAMKSNRKVSLSEEDKQQGRSQCIDTVDFTEGKPVKGWIAGLDFPSCCSAKSLKTRAAAQAFSIWYAVIWTATARPSRQFTKNGGKSRSSIRR